MFIEQPPAFVRKLYPRALWRMDPTEKKVYLTFDDGPIPEVTPWVLRQLDHYGVKATFFMVGDNIRKHPDVFRQVLEQGHRIGNHTFHHLRGFEHDSQRYLDDVGKAQDFMLEACSETANDLLIDHALYPILFRPPHGHLTWGQYMVLRKKCQIVMWDLVTRDYSKKMRPPQVLANVMRYARNGSIITFHDSLKSWNNGNLSYALPRGIEFLQEEGYSFGLL